MKKDNLLEGILFILGGMILLGVALLTDSVLDSLLIGFAAGAICSGTVMTCKYFYWNTSKNKERYQEKIENEKIELYDELKSNFNPRKSRPIFKDGFLRNVIVSIFFLVFSSNIPLYQILPQSMKTACPLLFHTRILSQNQTKPILQCQSYSRYPANICLPSLPLFLLQVLQESHTLRLK